MPTQVQNIVLPPIQKIIPQPPKPADDAAPRREEFKDALKTARKKSDDAARADSPKVKTKDTKAESKDKDDDDDDDKSAAKSSKHVSKTSKQAKPAKAAKSKTDKLQKTDETDESDEQSETQDAAAADADSQPATPEQVQASATSQTKVPAQAKDDPDHQSKDQPKPAASDATATHLVQPIDQPKDQKQHRKNPNQDETEDQDADAPAAAKNVAPIAKALDPSQNAAEQSPPSQPSQTDPAHTAPAQTETPSAHRPAVIPIKLGDDAPVAIKSPAAPQSAKTTADTSSTPDFAAQFAQLVDSPDTQPADTKPEKLSTDLDPAARAALAIQSAPAPQTTISDPLKAADAPPLPPPEIQFAQSNHENIVTSVQSQLLPHGGTMQIRLDPPELGALRVMVEMRDGVMSATFETSNEQATQLLSHSLNQLKHVLETQGVSVERLQVQQAPKNEHSNSSDDHQQQQQRGTSEDHAARQEQQRKEMMRRMWRRVSGAGDPIDYLA